MEKLSNTDVIQFHLDTFEVVRKEHGLDRPGQMNAAIDLLDDWIKKQPHFVKHNFSREYLERTIILDKGSVERAKTQLDKLFTMKTILPQFFSNIDSKAKEYEILHQYYVHALLPKLTKDHYRIYAGKVIKEGFNTAMFMSSFKFGTMIMDYIRANDYSAGFIGLLDYRNVNLVELVSQINFLEMHQFIMILMEGYQMRVKGIHFMTNSKAIELLVRIFKQAFSKKVGDRMFVHMTEESLHKHIPKEILPKEFGGDLKSLVDINRDFVEELSRKEVVEYFEEINQAHVNEKLRIGDKSKNELLGISGSFRTLSVD